MRLLYATSIHFPSRLANRIQTVAMARAFHALLGDDFVFGIGENENGTPLPGDVIESGNARNWRRALFYLWYARRTGITHIYCREEKLLFFLILFSRFFPGARSFTYEIHHLKYAKLWWHRYALRRVDALVSITAAMKDELAARYGYTGEALVAHDAVDATLFDIPLTKREARGTLGLPADKKLILYAGSLEMWKGGGTFYEAAMLLDDSYLFLLVGGKENWVEHFRKTYPAHPRVVMLGQKDYETELPRYLKAADVAVIPNTAKEEISRICTSPLKLFAYMASGTPIVASDVPALREVVDERSAIMVSPDDARALADGIRTLAEDPERGRALASRAREDVRAYSWSARARSILDFIS